MLIFRRIFDAQKFGGEFGIGYTAWGSSSYAYRLEWVMAASSV